MSDLTVLISPIPLYPSTRPKSPGFNFSFARRSPDRGDLKVSLPPGPVMVTLQTESPTSPRDPSSTTHRSIDPGLLSPPPHNHRARQRFTQSSFTPSLLSTPTGPPRPLSAPPLKEPPESSESLQNLKPPSRPVFTRRRVTSFGSGPHPNSAREGGLLRPPPPLFRPTTFWRKTRRSGVTSASYSPSSHLIRRSTFVAAGLTLDAPIADLSALCVESRVAVVYLPDLAHTTSVLSLPQDNSNSLSSSPTPIHHLDVNYARQGPPWTGPAPDQGASVTTSSSSFDYWWPYPPAGATTVASSTPTIFSLSSAPLALTSYPIAFLPNTTSTPHPSSVTTSSAPLSSSGIISISALPPATTPMIVKTTPKSSKTTTITPATLAWLAPLCGVLGVALGAVGAWAWVACVVSRCHEPGVGSEEKGNGPESSENRRRKWWIKNSLRNFASLRPGPAYEPAHAADPGDEVGIPANTDGASTKRIQSHASNYAHTYLPSPTSIVGGGNMWLTRGLPSRERDETMSFIGDHTIGGGTGKSLVSLPQSKKLDEDKNADANSFHERGEEDPFVVRLSRAASSRTNTTAMSGTSNKGTSKRPAESFSILGLSLYDSDSDYEAHEEEDEVAYASLRHTSIRRGILERLHNDPPSPSRPRSGRRHAHARASSDVCLDDVNGDLQVPQRAYASPTKERGFVMHHESVREQDGDGNEIRCAAGSGFRIVEEDDPKRRWKGGHSATRREGKYAAPEGGAAGWISYFGTLSGLLPGDAEADKYTPLPLRRTASRGTKCRTPTSEHRTRHSSLPRVDSSVLPSSPPQITSPPLEAQLFFASPSAQAIINTRGFPVGLHGSNHNVNEQTRASPYPHIQPPSLPTSPLPSATLPRRKRLTKKPHGTGQVPESQVRQPSLHYVRTQAARGTSAQRYRARAGALQQVEEIVKKGLGDREC